jgi:hypothetical protein
MEHCKEVQTPMEVNVKLVKEMCAQTAEERDEMAKVPYRSAVGSLIYLVTCTRPDIAVAVSEVSKYLENPGIEHWKAVKRILRYLKGTVDYGLKYKRKGSNKILFESYCDANWGGDLDDRRSTTGFIVKMNDCLISWKTKRQSTVAKSTTEAEYMSLNHAAQSVMFFRKFANELGFRQKEPTKVYEDNQGCIILANNNMKTERSKHIDIQYHYIRELVEGQHIIIEYKSTDRMIADIMTKGLSRDKHKQFCVGMGLFSEESEESLHVEREC